MPSHRPLTTAGALLVVVLALLLGPALVAPGATGECASAAAAASGDLRVSIVVDTGSGSPSAVCVAVSPGATGADVLAERSRVLGTPAPRWDGSGLLCAIDGVPESGCGERTDDGYRYWSYWNGDGGSWAYSPIGPATKRVKVGGVEGWHFVEGAGNPTDPPPRAPADHRAVCGEETPATPPPATAPAPAPDPGPGPSPTTAPPASGSAGGSATTAAGSGYGSGTTTGPGTGSSSSTTAGGDVASAPVDDPGAAATDAGPDGTGPDGTTAEDGRGDAPAVGAATEGEQAAGLPTSATGSGDGGGIPPSTVLGLGLVAALGAGAAIRSRRLRSAP